MATFLIDGKDINEVLEIIPQSSIKEKSTFFNNPKINTSSFLGSGNTIANAPSGYWWTEDIKAGKLLVNGVPSTNSAKGCRPWCPIGSHYYGVTTSGTYVITIDASGNIKCGSTVVFPSSKSVKYFFVAIVGAGGGSGRGGNNNTGSGGGGGSGATMVLCIKANKPSLGETTVCTISVGAGGSAGGTGGTGGSTSITINGHTYYAYGGGGGSYADGSGNAAAGNGGTCSESKGTATLNSIIVGTCNGVAGGNGTAYNIGGKAGPTISCDINYFPPKEASKGIISTLTQTANGGVGAGGTGAPSVFAGYAGGATGGYAGNVGNPPGGGAGGGGCTGFFTSEKAGAAGAPGGFFIYYD